jgi:hypothetical protein
VISAQPLFERPEPGLARGLWAAPAWGIALVGIAVVVGAIAFVFVRLRSDRRASRGEP